MRLFKCFLFLLMLCTCSASRHPHTVVTTSQSEPLIGLFDYSIDEQVKKYSERRYVPVLTIPYHAVDTAYSVAWGRGLLQAEINGASEVIVVFDTEGGSVEEMDRIAGMMQRSPLEINCIVSGRAMSAGFYLLQQCHHRVIVKGSQLMVHRTWNPNIMPDAQSQAISDAFVDITSNRMSAVEASRMKIKEVDLEARIAQGPWYMDWEEALDYGAVDEAVEEPFDYILERRSL